MRGLQVRGNRRAQGGQAGGAGVVMMIGVDGRLGRRHDVRRGVEIRIAAAERDHVRHAGGERQHARAERAVFRHDARREP